MEATGIFYIDVKDDGVLRVCHSSSSSSFSKPQIHITSAFFYALSGSRCSQEFITVINSLYSIVLCNYTHDKPV